MSFLSSLFDWIKAIFAKIVDFVVEFIKKYWWVIAIVAVIYFAPAIAGYLSSTGAPSWLTSAFTWVGNTLTTPLVGALSSAWTWMSGVAAAGYASFAGAALTTQLGIIAGVGMLLAPEETTELISEAAEVAGEVVYAAGSAVVSGSGLGTVLTVGALGVGAYFLFFAGGSKSSDDGEEVTV